MLRGYLVGTRTGDTLSFRYSHPNTNGEASNGRCDSSMEATDGRPCLSETWGWESREGAETSILEEFGRGPREPENANPLYFRRIVNGQPTQCT